MKKRYQVFVSSTYNDLIEERAIVKKALLEKGLFPTAMEEFPAVDLNQMDYIKELLDGCDYYILILGGCLGSIDKTTKKSYTRLEYEYAKEKEIPILAIVKKHKNEIVCKETGKRRKEYSKFVREATTGRICKFYSKKDELSGIVHLGMNVQIEKKPRPGWIRQEKKEYITAEDYLLKGDIQKAYIFDKTIYTQPQECIDVGKANGKHIEIYYGSGTQATFNIILAVEGHNESINFYHSVPEEFFDNDALIDDAKMQISLAKLGNYEESLLFFTIGDSIINLYTEIYRIGSYALERIATISGQKDIWVDYSIQVPFGSQGLYAEYIYLNGKIYKLDGPIT